MSGGAYESIWSYGKSRNATPGGVPVGFIYSIPSPFLSCRAVARFLLQLSARLESAELGQREWHLILVRGFGSREQGDNDNNRHLHRSAAIRVAA